MIALIVTKGSAVNNHLMFHIVVIWRSLFSSQTLMDQPLIIFHYNLHRFREIEIFSLGHPTSLERDKPLHSCKEDSGTGGVVSSPGE